MKRAAGNTSTRCKMRIKTGSPVQVEDPDPFKKGKFIVLEGSDGVGKSTLMAGLASRLRERGVTVVTTHEPTGNASVYGLILEENRFDRKLSLQEIYWLFQLDRSEHSRNLIEPTLAKGWWVLCDRYFFSTMVYQSPRLARDHGEVSVESWMSRIWDDVKASGIALPDMTFLLDMASSEALSRIKEELDVYELDPDLEKNRKRYEDALLSTTIPYRVIDASQDANTVLNVAFAHIEGEFF